MTGLRVVFVGCGSVFNVWSEALGKSKDPRFSVSAVIDLSLDARNRAGANFPSAERLSSVENLGPGMGDVAVVLTPPLTHATTVRSLLALDYDVLTEKPLGLSHREARSSADQAVASGRYLAVLRNRSDSPSFVDFAASVLGGEDRVPLDVAADTKVSLATPGFRAHRPSILEDLSVHAFDQVQRLVAAPPKTIRAREPGPLKRNSSVAADALIELSFEDGSLFSWYGAVVKDRQYSTGGGGKWAVSDGTNVREWSAPSSERGNKGHVQAVQVLLNDYLSWRQKGVRRTTLDISIQSTLMLEMAVLSSKRGGEAIGADAVR